MMPVDFKDKQQDEDKPYEENDAIFDGEFLKKRMARFLQRINHALNEAQQHLPDFEILNIEVTSVVSINGEVSFPSGGGIGGNKSRAITFQLRPKAK